MDDRLVRLFPSGSAAPEPIHVDRRRWLRRLIILLASAGATFGLTAAWLSHISTPLSLDEADAEASDLVRAHFSALQRGDFRGAYLQFTRRYRNEIPYAAFHDMVIAHWSLFRERRLVLLPQAESVDRVVLATDFTDATGSRFDAEFTVLRIDGRWWLDNVRWDREDDRQLMRA